MNDIIPTFTKKEVGEIEKARHWQSAVLGYDKPFSFRGKHAVIPSVVDCRKVVLIRLLKDKNCLNLRVR